MKKMLPVITGISLSLLATSVFSNPYSPYSQRYYGTQPRTQQSMPAPRPRSQVVNPSQVIQDADKKLKQFVTSDQVGDPKRLRAFLEVELIPLVDFKHMMRSVAGPFLRHMNQEKLTEFQAELKEDFTTTLMKHLGTFDAKSLVEIGNAKMRNNGEAIVSTRVYRQSSTPVRLDFRMKRDGNSWRVIDVQANGSSAIVFYRNFFKNEMRRTRQPYGGSCCRR